MKKLLGIIVLGLLLSGNAYAKTSVRVEAKTSDYITLSAKNRFSNKKSDRERDVMANYAYEHCQSHNKNSYNFFGYSDGSGYYKKGDFLDDRDETKYTFRYISRFFCSDSVKNALLLFNKNYPSFFLEK